MIRFIDLFSLLTSRRTAQPKSPFIESLELRQLFDAAPTVELLGPPEVQANHYALHVRYSDDTAINTQTIDVLDVRLVDENGAQILATSTLMSEPQNGAVDVTYFFERPSVAGTYSFNLQPDEVTDENGNPVPAGTLAQIEEEALNDTEPPEAELTSPPQRIGDQIFFTITYSDNVAIDNDSIIDTQAVVVVGRGYEEVAQLQNIVTTPEGEKRATYAIPAPSRPGQYRIILDINGVTDTRGNPVPAGELARFIVTPKKARVL